MTGAIRVWPDGGALIDQPLKLLAAFRSLAKYEAEERADGQGEG